MTVALLNHLLAHHLAQADAVPAALAHVVAVLASSGAIHAAELEEGTGGPVLHRWNLRLASLISPSSTIPVRAAGFRLLTSTYSSSTTSLLSHAKTTLTPAINVLSATNPDPTLFLAALEAVKLVLALSTWHHDWAREVVGAQVVQKVVQSLVKAAASDVASIRLASLSATTTLLPLFPAPLRPLSPSLHTLAISLICDPDASPSTIDSGATLFVSLYLLSPKGKDGLRDAWKKGVEALIGSADALIPAITTDVFAEDPTLNHTLTPLSLPALTPLTPFTALTRLESLVRVLTLFLRTPTSEKTGEVDIPLGALVELGVRLVGLNVETPIKERTDPTTVTLSLSLLPKLQVAGCELLAQLGLCVGPRLSSHAPDVLNTVSKTLSYYPLRSTMRPTLSTTYSILLESIGSAVDPEEGKKSLARVWRSVLEDIGSVALEPVVVAASEDKGRKNKRQKTYDPSESMEARRVRLTEEDLGIAERALSTLTRLLASPHSHFLPPKLQISTSRLLLAIALDPSFSASHSSTSQLPTFFPATSATRGTDIAEQSEEFRRGVVRALKMGVEVNGGGVDGVVERCVEVWKRGCMDVDPEIKALSHSALAQFSTIIHPSLPPQQLNTTFLRLKQERTGAPLGDGIEVSQGATEFAAKEVELVPAEEGEGMEVDNDEVVEEEEKEEVRVAPQPAFFAPAPSGGFGGGGGFASSFLAAPSPAVEVKSTHTTMAVEEPKAAKALAAPTFAVGGRGEKVAFSEVSSKGTGTGGATKRKVEEVMVSKVVEKEDSSDDEDEGMPTIDVGSDDE